MYERFPHFRLGHVCSAGREFVLLCKFLVKDLDDALHCMQPLQRNLKGCNSARGPFIFCVQCDLNIDQRSYIELACMQNYAYICIIHCFEEAICLNFSAHLLELLLNIAQMAFDTVLIQSGWVTIMVVTTISWHDMSAQVSGSWLLLGPSFELIHRHKHTFICVLELWPTTPKNACSWKHRMPDKMLLKHNQLWTFDQKLLLRLHTWFFLSHGNCDTQCKPATAAINATAVTNNIVKMSEGISRGHSKWVICAVRPMLCISTWNIILWLIALCLSSSKHKYPQILNLE